MPVNRFTLTKSCYKIVQELKKKGYEVHRKLSGVEKMKEHSGGLGNFLNEVTQTADKGENAQVAEQIVYIDIDELESNPKNFYGLRDVDALAGLIAVSHLIEPLTVSKKENGKYMIISGHRRRAAVQKLLEEGVYTERRLPCIVKTRGKIAIEQEDGEIIEFDEDAVEILNLIASNRGQREERTVDEKLQEVKYLESFAKAIYHQKNRGTRGRFRSFFAEEILSMSKSQLQRISAMEKLTDKVKAAVDDKTISESAALAMANMTPEEQEACLEKIESGEIRGTAQDIQNLSASKVAEEIEDALTSENVDSNSESNSNDSAVKDTVSEEITTDSVTEDTSSNVEMNEEVDTVQSQETNSEIEGKPFQSEKTITANIIDVPEEIGDPQEEAQNWSYLTHLAIYEIMQREAKRLSEEEEDELKAAQWGIRASVARYDAEKFRLQHEENRIVKS